MLYNVKLSIVVGLGITALAALAPVVDVALSNTVLDHVRAAYPRWALEVATAERNWIIGWLVATGTLGVAGWLLVLRGVAHGRGWAWPVSLGLFGLGAAIAVGNLTVGAGRYDTIVPGTFGWLTTLPVLMGLLVLLTLRRPE